MSEKHIEALSAFVDGELSEEESRFLMRALDHDPELIAQWRRFHLTRDVLRGGRVGGVRSISLSVSAAVEAEPAQPGRSSGTRTGPVWLRPAAGMAVAASVALLAFNLLQPDRPAGVPQSPGTVIAQSDNPNFDASEPLRQRATVASGSRMGNEAWQNPRIQAYLLRHNELASPRRSRGLVPYVYLVSTPAESGNYADDEAVDDETKPADGVVAE